jgi:L,D-transpeptidase ErfK/SrfK
MNSPIVRCCYRRCWRLQTVFWGVIQVSVWHYAQMRNTQTASLLLAALLAAGCQTQPQQTAPLPVVEPQPVVPEKPADPIATHLFKLQDGQEVVGEIQVTTAGKDDTLSDIARRFNLGYDELVRANPGVDPWIPGEGREIVLPTQFVLPDAPHEGLVVNLAALRVFYFPKRKPGELQTVITHPIGIGKVGWNTPEGETKVVSKRKNPTWIPPASVRKEHAERGDPLPKIVPAGDDNPLGAYAMNLGWAGYLIHGTNKPYGVGMRSSHGCMRFYPEDIALLFDEIAIGTKVKVVNQRLLSGWRDGQLYVQVMPPSDEEVEQQQKAQQVGSRKQGKVGVPPALVTKAMHDKWVQQTAAHDTTLNDATMQLLVQQKTGVTTPVSGVVTEDQYLAQARRVENRVPDGATWNGNKELLVTAEEFEAMKNGTILPKKDETKSANEQSADDKSTNTDSSDKAQTASFVRVPAASTRM